MNIRDFKKVTRHPAINFRALCNDMGMKYSKMFQAVQNQRELTVTESKQIEQYLSANGIEWETLIQSQGNG